VDFELDHVLVWVGPGAPEAERLVAFGLTEGTRNLHTGQGTANRRFFFRNAMLELIWVHDETEAQTEPGARLGIRERWRHRETGASPFGLCLRRRPGLATGPFETWAYRPAYLPAGLAIDMAATSPQTREPLVFLAATRRPDAEPGSARQPLVHAAGVREVSAVRIGVPGAEPLSATLQAVEATGVATFPRGAEHRLELGFDGERQGGSVDFRPDLPLVFRW
jgi:Glyoxalase-like domain